MWTANEAWRAPVGDFPPPWASAWGDDPYGLWADLTVNGITQRMRWIEPSGPEGFLMGSTQEERDAIVDTRVRNKANEREQLPSPVVIKRGFWLADTPCTQAFWVAVMRQNPSQFRPPKHDDQCPVDSVTIDELERFFKRFSATPEWGCGERIGLLSEAQWEYAARAGTTTAYWWGDLPDSAMANWNGEHGGTTPVKKYRPNPWGLFDVHGNVWELCADPKERSEGVFDGEADASYRIVRGGSWHSWVGRARSAFRNWGREDLPDHRRGLRIALWLPLESSP